MYFQDNYSYVTTFYDFKNQKHDSSLVYPILYHTHTYHTLFYFEKLSLLLSFKFPILQISFIPVVLIYKVNSDWLTKL